MLIELAPTATRADKSRLTDALTLCCDIARASGHDDLKYVRVTPIKLRVEDADVRGVEITATDGHRIVRFRVPGVLVSGQCAVKVAALPAVKAARRKRVIKLDLPLVADDDCPLPTQEQLLAPVKGDQCAAPASFQGAYLATFGDACRALRCADPRDGNARLVTRGLGVATMLCRDGHSGAEVLVGVMPRRPDSDDPQVTAPEVQAPNLITSREAAETSAIKRFRGKAAAAEQQTERNAAVLAERLAEADTELNKLRAEVTELKAALCASETAVDALEVRLETVEDEAPADRLSMVLRSRYDVEQLLGDPSTRSRTADVVADHLLDVVAL